MRAVVAIFVCFGLLGLECTAHAEQDGFAYTGTPTTAFTGAVTGGSASHSVRGMIRQRCLALLSFIGHHVESGIRAGQANGIYFGDASDNGLSRASLYANGSPASGLPNPDQNRITGLTERLMSVEANFALGGGKFSTKRPIRLGLSASPHRVRLTAKLRF